MSDTGARIDNRPVLLREAPEGAVCIACDWTGTDQPRRLIEAVRGAGTAGINVCRPCVERIHEVARTLDRSREK